MNTSMPPGAEFDQGVFTQVLRPCDGTIARPALFLDRDGVVVIEAHYLHKVENVELIPGAAATIAAANQKGIPVIFVTNQAGVGYGYFGWPDFYAVQDRIFADLAAEGAFVDGVYACPFHENGKPPYDQGDHPCRKPNPGMLLGAANTMNIDLRRSWIVGDRAGDVLAGKNAGLAGGV
ncbi:MAG TPA: HAD family hydrolase, partial [Rhodospirillales bacterium]|nr:HAD family hydrolase [Rhodospirillales bacterium]